MKKKSLILGVGMAVLLAAGAWVFFRLNGFDFRWTASHVPPPRTTLADIDLSRPDALLVTRSLSELPRDIRTLPVFQEVLTEDFFFHYEENEERLSFSGTLRRIAFEHDLSLGDEILAYVFNSPAQIAMWKSRDGTLGHHLLILDRSGLVGALELAAKVVLNDRQLKPAGTIALAEENLPVYELRYGHRRHLFFTSHADKLLVFSDAEILLPKAETRQKQVRELLAANDPGVWLAGSGFGLKAEDPASAHTLAVSAHYLSFGYQRFFPAFAALRFDFTGERWHASALLEGAMPSARDLWQAAPMGPALCVALPVEPARVKGLLNRFVAENEAENLASVLAPPAAVCWYREAELYEPLVLVKTNGDVSDDTLKTLFEKHIGTHEAGRQPPENADPPPPKTYYPPFAVQERREPGGTVWRRAVSSPYGSRPGSESADAEKMRSARYFDVSLARWKDMLLFSPDGKRVDDAIATLEKRYPALADSLPADSDLALVAVPEQFGELVRTAVLDSLPEAREAVFRQNVSARLLPVLDRFKTWPAYGLATPKTSSGWEQLAWQPLAAR